MMTPERTAELRARYSDGCQWSVQDDVNEMFDEIERLRSVMRDVAAVLHKGPRGLSPGEVARQFESAAGPAPAEPAPLAYAPEGQHVVWKEPDGPKRWEDLLKERDEAQGREINWRSAAVDAQRALGEVAGYVHDKATRACIAARCNCNDGPQHCSSCASRCREVDAIGRRIRHLLEVHGVPHV